MRYAEFPYGPPTNFSKQEDPGAASGKEIPLARIRFPEFPDGPPPINFKGDVTDKSPLKGMKFPEFPEGPPTNTNKALFSLDQSLLSIPPWKRKIIALDELLDENSPGELFHKSNAPQLAQSVSRVRLEIYKIYNSLIKFLSEKTPLNRELTIKVSEPRILQGENPTLVFPVWAGEIDRNSERVVKSFLPDSRLFEEKLGSFNQPTEEPWLAHSEWEDWQPDVVQNISEQIETVDGLARYSIEVGLDSEGFNLQDIRVQTESMCEAEQLLEHGASSKGFSAVRNLLILDPLREALQDTLFPCSEVPDFTVKECVVKRREGYPIFMAKVEVMGKILTHDITMEIEGIHRFFNKDFSLQLISHEISTE